MWRLPDGCDDGMVEEAALREGPKVKQELKGHEQVLHSHNIRIIQGTMRVGVADAQCRLSNQSADVGELCCRFFTPSS
jgi:hypothetical protein